MVFSDNFDEIEGGQMKATKTNGAEGSVDTFASDLSYRKKEVAQNTRLAALEARPPGGGCCVVS